MSLPLPPQSYSADDQAQTRSQIVQQLLQQQATLQHLSAQAASYPVWDLRHYAALARITLGQGNDQPAFDAAHAAMAAKPARDMLYVYVPPGRYDLDQLLIYNAAGFYCDPGAAMLRQRPWTAPKTDTGLGPGWGAIAAKPFVRFGVYDSDDGTASSACSWLLHGFKLDGGWAMNWGDGAPIDERQPVLFHYAATEFSKSDRDRNACFGQTGVLLRGAFAPPAHLSVNSPFRVGDYNDARFLVGELDIDNFGGDGFHLQGTGAGVIGPIRVTGSGGRGIVLNSYDNKVGLLDAGGSGLEGAVFRGAFSNSTLAGAKFWFTGLRANAGDPAAGGLVQDSGHKVGCWFDTCGGLSAVVQVQDSVGSSFRIDGCQAPHFDLHADYAGLPPAYQTEDCGGIDFGLGTFGVNATQGGFIRFSASPAPVDGVGPYPHYKYVTKASAPLMGTVLQLGQYNMVTANPGDAGTDFVDPLWMASGDMTLIAYPASMPTAGQTLILNGSTVALGPAANAADVAAQINAAAIPGVTASNIYSALVVTSAVGSPATLSIDGTAAASLGLAPAAPAPRPYVVDSQSYYDTALVNFGTSIRAPRSWMANSAGYVPFGLGYAGVVATTAGVASLTAYGRETPVSIGVVDTDKSFHYPVYAQLDAAGRQCISFLGAYPPAPAQNIGTGPLPTDGSASNASICVNLNRVMATLLTFGFGNYAP